MIKVIASDIDGTLINSNGIVTPLTLQALKEAQNKGIDFVICTGRNYNGLDDIIVKNKLSCAVVSGNGGSVHDKDGKALIVNPVSKKEKSILLDIISDYPDVYFFFHKDEGFYSMNSKEELKRIFVEFAEKCSDRNEVDKCQGFYQKLLETTQFGITEEDVMKQPFLKAEAIFVTEAIYPSLLNRIKKDLNMNITSTSTGRNIELTNLKASKGKVLLEYIQILGIKPEEVAVFGDSMNDSSMFELFPESYAMDNAENQLKKMAKYITDSNNNDGVGKAVLKILHNNSSK